MSELFTGFTAAEQLKMDFLEVSPEEMPSASRQLLVHQKHMTRTLNSHYGKPVDVHVLERHHDGDLYSRKIFLTPREADTIVEYGLVRMDFRYMPHSVRDAILQEHAPLGSILINHNILRRIQPRWYLKFPKASTILTWFDCHPNEDLYGRLATIYCNGEPAIELVEIVTAVPANPTS
jgi:chorismate-pyruvate lyase